MNLSQLGEKPESESFITNHSFLKKDSFQESWIDKITPGGPIINQENVDKWSRNIAFASAVVGGVNKAYSWLTYPGPESKAMLDKSKEMLNNIQNVMDYTRCFSKDALKKSLGREINLGTITEEEARFIFRNNTSNRPTDCNEDRDED